MRPSAPLHAAQHAQVLQRQHRNLRIDDGGGDAMGAREVRIATGQPCMRSLPLVPKACLRTMGRG